MIFRTISIAFISLVIAGCQGWTLIEAKPYTLASGYTVEPTRTWSSVKVGNTHHMTIDGPGLQSLIITTDAKPGDRLIDFANTAGSNSEDTFPKYAAGLSPLEIVELLENSLEAWGFSKVVKSNIRQEPLNGEMATALDLTMTSSDGLEYRGFAYLVQRGAVLQFFMYYGTDLFHYEKNAKDAFAVIRSITWPEKET